MGRRTARSQLQALKRGAIAKDKDKEYERWMNQFATRADVDRMIRFYLDQFATAVDAAERAVEAELPVDEPPPEAA